uniref:Uncharacterized protein n=1 Tax=Globisporangium ultimum (strain ATCC 200006 / CBS 805.95 / DAOM BR144) TaxID=431595 RepID=K3WWQ8_GLOUD
MPSRIVKLSRTSYALWWVILLFVHAVAAAFSGFCAYFYQYILGKENNYLASCLDTAGIGMQAEAFPMVAFLQGLVALPHGLVILRMLAASLYYRSFAFMIESRDLNAFIYRLLCPRKAAAKVPSSDQAYCLAAVLRRSNWMRSLFDRTGLFGVDGEYFHLILFCRETFETSLQTNQAYRMSYYLPRDALNQFYVSLIVLNCWSTPLILRLYKRDKAKKRLLCLICDCVLDVVAAVVIPCAIIVTYIGDFDMELEAFPMALWYNDIWNMHALREFQILFVTSWCDLATRMVFSIGMLIAMSDIKDLLGARQMGSGRGNQVAGMELINPEAKVPAHKQKSEKHTALTPAPIANDILSTTSPRMASARVTSMRLASIQNRLRTASHVLKNPNYQRRFAHFVHMFVLLWGAVVLGLHLHAASKPVLSQCLLQLRPWGKPEPVCALVLLNCYELAINGTKKDVEAEWNRVDPEMVVQVVIRHCPAFEMPPIIQQFSQMIILKVYNSSITEWSADSALTATSHPVLESLLIVRVNITDGVLPPGLLSPEFPPILADIELSTTNLRALPDNLDTIWPTDAQLKFEYCAFTSIPDVVMRLLPVLLSFCGNPINEIPVELFAVESLRYLHIGDNQKLTVLPANATLSSSMGQIYIQHTQIAFFPSWLDPVVNIKLSQGYRLLRAVGVPYCEYAQPIYDRSLSNADAMAAVRAKTKTTAMMGPGEPSMLMGTSESARQVIYGAVKCEAGTEWTFFPLATEDEQSALR